MSNTYATIKIKPETREKIQSLGKYGDSYDTILNRLVARESASQA